MKKFIFKLFVIFILLFSFSVNASEKNLDYIEYEKLDENIKEKLDYIPSEYIVYYDYKEPSTISTLKRNLFSIFSATPSTYDLRNVNGSRQVPPMDDQGILGLCWAFTSNNVLESYYLKNKKGTIDLSDDQPSYVAKYFGDADFGKGNSAYNVLRYWFMGYSPVSENHFGKYSLTEKSVGYKDYLDNNNLIFDIKNVKVFPALNTTSVFSKYTLNQALSVVSQYNQDIKNHIMNYGAIFTGIFWNFYDSSKNLVYNDGTLPYDSYATSGHAVTIIGWDDNYEGVSINGNPVKGAWLAMNSWGDETQYFYISYYDIDVVKSLFGATLVENKEWNNSYVDYVLFKEKGNKKIYEFNKGTSSEKIESVKLLYKWNDTTAKVYVSDGFNTYESTTSTDITYGIKSYEFGNISFDREKIYVIVESPSESANFDVALFTSDVTTNKILEFEELEFNAFPETTKYYRLFSKNIDTGSNVTIKVYDNNNNDITSKFSIRKPVIINDYATVSLTARYSLNDYEYIKIEASVADVNTNLINYINGNGTLSNPYIIRTACEMTLLDRIDYHTKLGSNIDLNDEITSEYGLFYNQGYGWEPLTFTNSVLDGNGYTIKNLTSKLGGLFLEMNNSTLKNVKLEKFKLNSVGENSSTSIVAVEQKNNSKINNVFIDNASVVGGNTPASVVVGYMYDGEISDIHIQNSSLSSDIGTGIVAFNIINPSNSIMIRNVFSNKVNLTSSNKGLVSVYLNISGKSNNLKHIDIKNNVFNYNENVSFIKEDIINISDNSSYNVYNSDVILEGNVIKKDSEIYNSSVFDNFNKNIWSFDETNSAYLYLFEDEFINVSDSLVELSTYKLQTNVISQVKSKTSKNNFIKDISNLGELSYKIYSSNGSELSNNDYVSTGSYIDVNKGNSSQRYYIVVTGDVDGNGSSGAMDAYAIVLHTISKKEITGRQLLAADFNLDGSVGARDAYAIVLESIK